MKAERDSPRLKRHPSRSASGDQDRAKVSRTGNFSIYDTYDSMDMSPLIAQFRTIKEHYDMKQGESAFGVLPNEAILIIFSYLEVSDLFQARLVSRDWCSFADDNLIWKSLTLCDFGIEGMYGSTWKETYSYLDDLFSDGLWEGMSKWVEPEGFDNEQKTTARLHFIKRKKSNKEAKSKLAKPITSSPATLHRVDSSSNAGETKSGIPTYENSLFKIAGQGVTINCSSPSPFRIEGERVLSDPTLQTFVWNKHFDKHTSVYRGTMDYAKRTVSGTIDYHDGTTHWKGVFYYAKAKKSLNVKYNSKQAFA